MTAQEWLDELERLRKAATPGPWICKEGEGFDEDDACITAEEREGMIDIAKIERGSPNAGMDEPFQSEQTANAASVIAQTFAAEAGGDGAVSGGGGKRRRFSFGIRASGRNHG